MKSEGEFKKEKEGLAKKIDWLLKGGKALYDRKVAIDQELEEGGFLTKLMNCRKIRKASSE